MTRRAWAAALLAVAAIVSFSLLTGAAGRPIAVDDLMKLHSVNDVRISPAGDRVAYVASVPSLLKNEHEAALFVVPANGGTPVRLAMTASGLELSATAQELADAVEAIDAKFEGSDVTVAFNPQFLLDGLNAIAGEEAVLETMDPLKPATLKGSDQPEFLYLLMPVRIS